MTKIKTQDPVQHRFVPIADNRGFCSVCGRERDQRWHATAEQLMETTSERYYRKLYAEALELHAKEIARLQSERDALKDALITARHPISVAASYADDSGISLGLKLHAESCVAALRAIDAVLTDE